MFSLHGALMMPSKDILAKICNTTRETIAADNQATPLPVLQQQIEEQAPPRGFAENLRKAKRAGRPGLIAEIKKASPSKGVIREDFNPATLAKAYEDGGADCLSVLTDKPYFQGDPAYIGEAKSVSDLPVLRKDFMLDPYQVYQARALGADCILLIMAALKEPQAKELRDTAAALGMDVLAEIHDIAELDIALAIAPEMIGINARNLKTLEVDINLFYEARKCLPDDIVTVAESGITGHDTLMQIFQSGYDSFLVGESLMRQNNVESATRALLNG